MNAHVLNIPVSIQIYSRKTQNHAQKPTGKKLTWLVGVVGEIYHFVINIIIIIFTIPIPIFTLSFHLFFRGKETIRGNSVTLVVTLPVIMIIAIPVMNTILMPSSHFIFTIPPYFIIIISIGIQSESMIHHFTPEISHFHAKCDFLSIASSWHVKTHNNL